MQWTTRSLNIVYKMARLALSYRSLSLKPFSTLTKVSSLPLKPQYNHRRDYHTKW